MVPKNLGQSFEWLEIQEKISWYPKSTPNSTPVIDSKTIPLSSVRKSRIFFGGGVIERFMQNVLFSQ